MALDLIKEQVKINQVVGEDLTQAIVEGDIIVPDTKPDVVKILQADGDVFIGSRNIMQDKVLIDGVVRFKIIYLAEDSVSCIKSIQASVAFSQSFEVLGARPGMRCTIKCDLEHINQSIINSRKINVSAVLDISCKVVNDAALDIVSDIAGAQDIQTLKCPVKVNNLIGDVDGTFNYKENLDIPVGKPSIKDILRSDVKITSRDIKLTDNKVLAKGELVFSTLYVADDEERSIQFMEHEIPFNEFIDLAGVTENSSSRMEITILDTVVEPCEDSDGELRAMHYEVILKIRVAATEQVSMQVIEDSYCPSAKIEIEKKPVVVDEIIGENASQAVIKDTVSIPENTPGAAQIFNVICKPFLTDYTVAEEKVMVEGVINTDILYLAVDENQPVCGFKQDIPFRHYLDVKGAKPGMLCDVEVDIHHYSYSMISSTEMEVRFVLGVRTRVAQQNTLYVVSKAEELPFDEKKHKNQPSVTLYYVQNGDNMWKIAKKYSATMESIAVMNGLSNYEAIAAGQQLIIPRK